MLMPLKDSVFVFPIFYVLYELKMRPRNWWDISKCSFLLLGKNLGLFLFSVKMTINSELYREPPLTIGPRIR